MNVNCNGNSGLRSVRLKPILPDYQKKERVNENLAAAEEADVQKAMKPVRNNLSITANANDILALYNIGVVSGVRGNDKPEAAQVIVVPRDDIFHDEGYDELVAEWEQNGENLCSKDKIKLLSSIINRTGNDETSKNMWCAIRFEITNNIYRANINNLDEQDELGYTCLMNYLQNVLDVIKGNDRLSANECTKEENSTEQKLIGYRALLSEQKAVIAVCEKLLQSPHIRRKDYPVIKSRLEGATENAQFYISKIKELKGISVSLGDIGEPVVSNNEIT